jgi:hypothetical protein
VTSRVCLVAATAACAALACASLASAAGDDGSGTYTGSGRTYYFDLFNSGTTPWQTFVLIGPPGIRFVGAATAAENTARCVPGQPDGLAEEIECGPIAATVMRPGTHILLVGTMSAPVTCGPAFRLEVSSTGATPFANGSDVTDAGCAAQRPSVRTPPLVHGAARVGGVLTATPPVWSDAPESVRYQWQRCVRGACVRIKGATSRTLRLTRADAGRSIRVAATAVVEGVTLTSRSKPVAVTR